jgi:type I restriction enzyme, S subunit
VGACDAKIAALERESALLDELFRALLEELMTGRVRATDGNG